MKRYRGVWPEVCSFAALHAAFGRARRGKRRVPAVQRFERDLEERLVGLRESLLEDRWRPAPHRRFVVLEPRKRQIAAAPFEDRVVHHALVDAVEPRFDRHFAHDSHACRKGHGTHRAADRFQHFARRHRFVLQVDVRRFFDSVDHGIVLGLLERRIVDPPVVNLFARILAGFRSTSAASYFPGDDLFTPHERPRGLPVGNLPSQFLANVLLDPVDQWLLHGARLRFVRYCDDLAVFCDDKTELRGVFTELTVRLADLRLRPHPKKCRVVPVRTGPSFVGYRIWPDRRRLCRENVRAFRRRLRSWQAAYRRGDVGLEQITPRVRAWIAHARHANTASLREEIFGEAVFRR